MTKRHRTTRPWRRLRWVGLALTLLVAALMVASVQRRAPTVAEIAGFRASVHLEGFKAWCWMGPGDDRGRVSEVIFVLKNRLATSGPPPNPVQLARFRTSWFPRVVNGGLVLPLHTLLIAIIIPTALMLWRSRRWRPPGSCESCAYPLRCDGAVGCPECGWGREA